jgi:hypothetical protein
VKSTPSIEVLHEARRNANRTRTNALLLVADGLLNPIQVIEQASTPAGRPLRKITLYQLLVNQPGWGRSRAKEIIEKVSSISEEAVSTKDLTILWLLNYRTHGRRIQSLINCLPIKVGTTPWPGFPLHQGTNYE